MVLRVQRVTPSVSAQLPSPDARGVTMRNPARQTREHRTITVDFRSEATCFKLLGDGKAFLACGVCVAMKTIAAFTDPSLLSCQRCKTGGPRFGVGTCPSRISWPSSHEHRNMDGKSRGRNQCLLAMVRVSLSLLDNQCASPRPWQRVFGHPLVNGGIEARGKRVFQPVAALLSGCFHEANARLRGLQ